MRADWSGNALVLTPNTASPRRFSGALLFLGRQRIMADKFTKCARCGHLFNLHDGNTICVYCRRPTPPDEMTPEAGRERLRALNRKLHAQGSSLREAIHEDDD